MVNQSQRLLIRRRANDICEYCRLPQAASPIVRFHVEHIIALQHGGSSENDNLALACSNCNFHKGPNIAGIDPHSGQLVPLFHPRQHHWLDHFTWDGVVIVGLTPIGRATVELLEMNSWERVEIREHLQSIGELFAG